MYKLIDVTEFLLLTTLLQVIEYVLYIICRMYWYRFHIKWDYKK
jgi:hypothetical protein